MSKTQIALLPIPLERGGKHSLQRQIFSQIVGMIESGVLPPGEPLISVRDFSRAMAVSRNTVALAFQLLSEEGWIETRAGRLSTVAQHPPRMRAARSSRTMSNAEHSSWPLEIPPPQDVHPRTVMGNRNTMKADFRVGAIAGELWPTSILKEIDRSRLIRQMADYQSPQGMTELRKAIAQFVSINRGIFVDESHVIIVNGIQEGLNLVARTFINPGIQVLLEDPCYRGAFNLFNSTDNPARLLDVDAEGVILPPPDWKTTSVVHVTPAHQYPLGISMSLTRRKEWVKWARQSGSLIIENSYGGDFSYEHQNEPAIAALAPERVIYLGSFTRMLGPGFRLGFMVCPHSAIDSICSAKSLFSAGTSSVEQAIVAEIMKQKMYTSQLRRMRRFYMSRRDMLVSALATVGGEIMGERGAMHICWALPSNFPNAPTLQEMLSQIGIRVYTLNEVAVNKSPLRQDRMLVLGYGDITPASIYFFQTALKRLMQNF